MIKFVVGNIRPSIPHRFIFICQRTHVKAHNLRECLSAWAPDCVVVEIEGITDGAACTVLAARQYIENEMPLMIANSDQYVDIKIDDYLSALQKSDLNGLIMTMTADDPKWSFAALDGQGLVSRVVEKQVISRHATVGIYNFRRGYDFVTAADAMIQKDLRVNNEFYVAPVYNELIAAGAKIAVYNVGTEGDGMYGLGTPKDLELFLSLPFSHQVAQALK